MLLLAAAPAQARQEDEQLWFQANINVPLTPKVRLTLEQISRFSDRQDGLYQTEFGALFSTPMGQGVELGAGYRRVGSHNGNSAADEDRLRQQVVVNRGRVNFRFRVDERVNTRASGIGIRIRPLLRYNQPLGQGLPALFVSHESFFLPNSTSWGQRRGYERMRNIVGISARLAKAMVADVGYLNQYRFARGRARGQMDHALSLQLTVNFKELVAPSLHD